MIGSQSWSSNRKVDVVAGGDIPWDKGQGEEQGIIFRIESQSHTDLAVLVSRAFVAFGSFRTLSSIRSLSTQAASTSSCCACVFIHFLIPVCISSSSSHSLCDAEFINCYFSLGCNLTLVCETSSVDMWHLGLTQQGFYINPISFAECQFGQ